MTTAPTTTPWYDSHANLYTLAEWIRENNGWAFFKENALDVLEKPWKWENEWRLASGAVEFEPIERGVKVVECCGQTISFEPDATSCVWCQTLVGYVDFESEFGPETEWVVAYVDLKSGDLACDDCAGQASNFSDTTNVANDILATVVGALPGLPEVTPEMRTHFKAFDHTELFPVLITKDVKTELGNVLIPEGKRTWGARNIESHGSICVWTKETHYAGVSSSSIPVACFIRLAGSAVTL